MRIVRTRYKVIFLVATLLGLFLIERALGTSLGFPGLQNWLGVPGTIIVALVAVRTFRVPEEEIAPPRAWWRMTGRPTAGFVVGGLSVVNGLVSTWGLIHGTFIEKKAYPDPAVSVVPIPLAIVGIVFYFALAYFFIRSSVRLTRS